jgi:hypothetical protein
VTDWIRQHIEDNPLVILTPVFKDYDQHLKEITEKFAPSSVSGSVGTAGASAVTTAASVVTAVTEAEKGAEAAAPKGFSFGLAAKKDESSLSTGFKVCMLIFRCLTISLHYSFLSISPTK